MSKKIGHNSDYRAYMKSQVTPKSEGYIPKKKYKSHSTFDEFFNLNNKPTRIERIVKSQSLGEKKIYDWLSENQIKFHLEKEFNGLKNPATGEKLRMDFYLPDHKICIEFDGKQHFFYAAKFDKGSKDNLYKRKLRDESKNVYCENKGIKMIRIRYSQMALIPHILKTEIF